MEMWLGPPPGYEPPRRLRVRFFFAWYDGWFGYYWDRKARALYLCPFPWFVFRFAKENA